MPTPIPQPAFARAKEYHLKPEFLAYQYEQCKQFMINGQYPQAEHLLHELLNHDYNDDNALFMLGTLYQKTDREGAAISLLKQVLARKGRVSSVYNNLGACFHVGIFNGEALDAYLTANMIAKEKDPDILGNIGGMYVNVGAPELGLPWFEKALAIDPEQQNVHWNRSLCLLEMERWAEGFDEYEYGLKTGDRKSKIYTTKAGVVPHWDGTPVESVIICGEQGIGDELMFSTILPEVFRAGVKRIYFDCHPRLPELMEYHAAGKYGEMIIRPNRKGLALEFLDDIQPEAQICVGSLAKFFRRSAEAFNVPERMRCIELPEEEVARWRERIDFNHPERLKVGIAWEGGGKRTRRDLRSLPLTTLLPIFNTPGIDFINLQYKTNADQIASFNDSFGVELNHLIEDDDFYTYALLTQACDLVISVNQTLIHLCGVLGKECWNLTPYAAAWRYGLKNPKMVWYDSVLNFRQKTPGDWVPVLAEISTRLRDRVLDTSETPELIDS